jgi:hypothetical protein
MLKCNIRLCFEPDSTPVSGITDHSFTQPAILLSASISGDPGYFGER